MRGSYPPKKIFAHKPRAAYFCRKKIVFIWFFGVYCPVWNISDGIFYCLLKIIRVDNQTVRKIFA